VAAAAAPRLAVAGSQAGAALAVKFVGMMGYITRTDRSILVAMPGAHPLGHYAHVPFLMARAGSSVAGALGLTPMPGVAAGAFDDRLADALDSGFVFRCLEGCDLEIDAGGAEVINRATQLAQMNRITPGKRLRNDLRRWSSASVTLRGGALDNSAAHPDAGKIWSFGAHQQALTDATLFTAPAATLRLASGANVLTCQCPAGELSQLWVVSSAGPRTDAPDPKRLVHGEILFQFFANAESVTATCEQAEGRVTMATELPCSPIAYAARTIRHRAEMPPHVDLCYGGGWCEPCD
jgi:hypothetical protein